MRAAISPGTHSPSYEKEVFRLAQLKAAPSGVPIYQIGCPLDFLAGSEEPFLPRGSGEKYLPGGQ